MPQVEGSLTHGWVVWFTQDETDNIADSLGGIAAVAAAIPDPVVSKIIAAFSGVIVAGAKVAKRKGLSMGMSINLNPFFWLGLKRRGQSGGQSGLWKIFNPFDGTAIPFFYSKDDPASIKRWRSRFGLPN